VGDFKKFFGLEGDNASRLVGKWVGLGTTRTGDAKRKIHAMRINQDEEGKAVLMWKEIDEAGDWCNHWSSDSDKRIRIFPSGQHRESEICMYLR
jgi:hypothetical protein